MWMWLFLFIVEYCEGSFYLYLFSGVLRVDLEIWGTRGRSRVRFGEVPFSGRLESDCDFLRSLFSLNVRAKNRKFSSFSLCILTRRTKTENLKNFQIFENKTK